MEQYLVASNFNRKHLTMKATATISNVLYNGSMVAKLFPGAFLVHLVQLFSFTGSI